MGLDFLDAGTRRADQGADDMRNIIPDMSDDEPDLRAQPAVEFFGEKAAMTS